MDFANAYELRSSVRATPHLDLCLQRIVAGVPAVFYICAGGKARPQSAILNVAGSGKRHIDRPRKLDFVPLLPT